MWKTWTGSGQTMGPISSPQTTGPGVTAGGWHPTILYLIVLVVLEIFVVGLLSRTVLR
jgi:hypothetical protein